MKRLLLFFLALAAPAWAQPALFVARGPGITAYLFGSVHVLPPGTAWQSPAIRDAFVASGECWFEVELPEDLLLAMPAGMLLRGLDPAHPLPTLLSPVDARLLRRRVEAVDIPGGMAWVSAMRPWMAWLVLSEASYKKAGLRAEDGADLVLQKQARAAGKPIVALETVETQVDLVAGIREATALSLLRQALRMETEAIRLSRTMVAAWQAGRTDRLERVLRDAGWSEPSVLTETLLRHRNVAWAARLGAEEGTGKTIMVTVGAAHLVGRGNLRELLAGRHWTVERVKEGEVR